MIKRCELCKSIAKIYCESDQATLCWNCDTNVHSANFLVARHSRSLLCHSCQSPTPWSSSGPRLEPSTVSVCENCIVEGFVLDDDDRTSTEVDEEEYNGDEDEVDLDDDQAAPPASSSSTGKEFAIADGCVSIKRRNVADLLFEDDLNSSSVQTTHCTRSSVAAEITIRAHEPTQILSLPSRSETATDKLNKNRKRNMMTLENEPTTETVGGKSKATRAVGFDLNSSDWTL